MNKSTLDRAWDLLSIAVKYVPGELEPDIREWLDKRQAEWLDERQAKEDERQAKEDEKWKTPYSSVETNPAEMNDYGRTKYLRMIRNVHGEALDGIDVYSVCDSFDVDNSALAHAIKKLLCPGTRGKGDFEQDLREAIVAIERAITLGAKDEK